jgi:hypothetical protein
MNQLLQKKWNSNSCCRKTNDLSTCISGCRDVVMALVKRFDNGADSYMSEEDSEVIIAQLSMKARNAPSVWTTIDCVQSFANWTVIGGSPYYPKGSHVRSLLTTARCGGGDGGVDQAVLPLRVPCLPLPSLPPGETAATHYNTIMLRFERAPMCADDVVEVEATNPIFKTKYKTWPSGDFVVHFNASFISRRVNKTQTALEPPLPAYRFPPITVNVTNPIDNIFTFAPLRALHACAHQQCGAGSGDGKHTIVYVAAIAAVVAIVTVVLCALRRRRRKRATMSDFTLHVALVDR